MVTHTVESTRDTVRSGFLDPAAPPVAKIGPGDVVRYPNTWTHWGNEAAFGMTFADREPLRHRYPHGPYSMIGPVEVSGSVPGDALEFSLRQLRTIDWGWNSFPLGVGALPHDFDQPYVHYFRFPQDRGAVTFDDGVSVPMRPLLGVVAVEPAGDEPTSAITSGTYGGNLVLRDLNVGTHLFLPVQKPGGRLWLGDVHATQGDGVVDQTGVETAAEIIEARIDLHRRPELDGPLLETPDSWILVAFADSLDEALVACLRRLIRWLPAAAGVDAREAYALASMAASFRVTQYSNQTGSAYDTVPPKAVHVVLNKSLLTEQMRQRVDRWLRPTGGV
jgi:acetamidase/formamidase